MLYLIWPHYQTVTRLHLFGFCADLQATKSIFILGDSYTVFSIYKIIISTFRKARNILYINKKVSILFHLALNSSQQIFEAAGF